jgi:zinc protease
MNVARVSMPGRAALRAVAGAVFLVATQAAAQTITPPKLAFEEYTLPNGLQVILHEDHSTPIVAVNLWYHVGSKNEDVGRTGFAHLFEHMMFQGSQHHDTDFINTIEGLGSTDLNGTTDFDRTNYFETIPPSALERVLYLEADRMGWLLPAMTQERLDNQREVVKNERRQGVDNQPYGTVDERMYAVLYPSYHPYSWDVIGYMEDLTRASKEDVEKFFKTYYGPNNCTLVIAGDHQPAVTKGLIERYFGAIPPGPPVLRREAWVPELSAPVHLSMEDRVPLPRAYFAWHVPGKFQAGEADLEVAARILAQGKTSRLYKTLVYDKQIAQDVSAFVDDRELSSLLRVQVTAKAGHTLDEIVPIVMQEIEAIRAKPVSATEVERARTAILSQMVRGLERVGGFGGRSDRLAMYNTYANDPDYLARDFARYHAVTPASVHGTVKRWLHQGYCEMRVTPYPELAAANEASGFDRAKAPDVGNPVAFTSPQLQRHKLSNGLQIVLAESHKVPAVQMNLLVKGGWSADTRDKMGVASFMSRMQDEGTKKRTALEISEQAQLLGANLNTNSNVDNCLANLNALSARLAPSIDLWSDVVLNPAFPSEEIERQRAQVLGQIAQEKKQPVQMGIRILPGLLYGDNHPYGQPLTGSGTENSVKAIQREDLVKYHETWFRPNNATLVIVGDTKMDQIVPLLEKALGTWKPADVPQIAMPTRPNPTRTTVYLIDKPGAAQSVLLAGHLMPPKGDPDDVQFEVMNGVLGSNFASRINMNLREDKGYSYGAYLFPLEAKGQGMSLAFAQVRTDVTKESISELMKELRDIRGKRPPTDDEMTLSKNSLVLSLPGQYETMNGIANKINDIVTYGLPEDYHAKYPERVRATSTKNVVDVANKRVLPENLAFVVVGDRAVIEDGVKSLGLGPIEYLDTDGRPLSTSAQR